MSPASDTATLSRLIPQTGVVSLCCNDPSNGEFSGRLISVSVEDLKIEHTYDEGCAVGFADGRVRISRRMFRHQGRKSWYGNWCWEAVQMERAETWRLLEYLRASGLWRCHMGPTELYNWWRTP